MNVRVVNSMLSSVQSFVNVEVESSTTVSELVKEALGKFELLVSAFLKLPESNPVGESSSVYLSLGGGSY